MRIASSTSPPGGAGPSATSCGVIPRASASAGASSIARRISSRRNMADALAVFLGPQKPSPLMGEGWVGVPSDIELHVQHHPSPAPPHQGEGNAGSIQIRAQPTLGLLNRDSAPRRIILQLV